MHNKRRALTKVPGVYIADKEFDVSDNPNQGTLVKFVEAV